MPNANPKENDFDLVITREINAPASLVWQCWTEPRHLEKWWAPKPHRTQVTKLDVRPGGAFNSIMHDEHGAVMYEGEGCFLEVTPERKLCWTDALTEGFRPGKEKPFMTAIVTIEPMPNGCRYTARVLHASAEDMKRHEEMGFFEGWGTVITQLAELVESMK